MDKLVALFLLGIEKTFPKRKAKKNVLLIAPDEIMFAYTKPIYDKLIEDKRFRPWFCFCSLHKFRKENLTRIRNRHRLRSISHRIAKYIKWDLVLYPVHHSRVRIRRDCLKIYIGHSLKSGKTINGESYKYGRHSRDENNNIIYDKIFAASAHEKEMTKQLYPEHYARVRVVGSLLADELLACASKRSAVRRKLGFGNGRKTVMVASTWGPHCFAQNSGIEFIGGVEQLLASYNVIFSLHHRNFQRKYSTHIDWQRLTSNHSLDNLYISTSNEESIQLLGTADLLITDHSSLGLYYLLLGRSVIFYENTDVEYEPGALMFELRNVAHVIRDVKNIENDIQEAFENCDRQKIAEAASKVCSYPTLAWRKYEQEIYDSLSLKKYSAIQRQT